MRSRQVHRQPVNPELLFWECSRRLRCPGEELTLQLMQTAAQLLVGSIRYAVPAQDLSVDLARIPALASSGFVMARPRRLAGPQHRPLRSAASPI